MASPYPTRTLREITRVIFSRLIGIAVILAAVVVCVIAATYLSPWQYRSKALLMARPAKATRLESTASMRERLSLFIVTQRELIGSDHVIASALMKLEGAAPKGAKGADGTQWYDQRQIADFVSANAAAMSDARGRVSVQTPGGGEAAFTQTFQVLVTWPEEPKKAGRAGKASRPFAAERARQFARNLLDVYRFRREVLELEQSRKRQVSVLKTTTAAARQALDDAAAALKNFIADKLKGDLIVVENMLAGVSETGSQSLRTRFEGELRTIEARLAEIKAIRGQIDAELAKDAAEQVVVPDAILGANPSLAKILEAIVALRLQLNTLGPRFTEDYKAIKETKAELLQNLGLLKEELTRQRTMLGQEQAALEGKRKSLEGFVNKDKSDIARLAPLAAEYQHLKDELANVQTIYNKRVEEGIAAENAEKISGVPIDVVEVDAPSLPDVSKPHRPILWVNVAISILSGVILSLVYAFLADHFDHTLKGMDDAEQHLGAPVLTSIPKLVRPIVRVAKGDTEVRAELTPKAEDLFRGLWASLFYTPQTPPKSLVICSANAGGGATTVACGLAVAGTGQAEQSRVALVDFNLRSPEVAERLRLPDGAGVSDVLVGEEQLDAALRRVGPGQLDVLTFGRQSHRKLNLLRADRVRQLLQELNQRYDQVIIDAAPANQYPDAQVLAELASGVVLVARCGQTPREALAQAKNRLERAAGKVLGVVLNMRKFSIPGFIYRRV